MKSSENNEWRDWLKHILDEVRNLREDQKTIAEDQKTISKTLTENTVSLQEHIRRTNLLERVVTEVKTDRKEGDEAFNQRLHPLEKQQIYISAYWKLALLAITILTSEAFMAGWKFIAEFMHK